MWSNLINRLLRQLCGTLQGGSKDQSSDEHSWQMLIVRVCQPLILGTRGAGEPRTRLQSTRYSCVGSGSPGAAHPSYVSPCWARSKGENGGLTKHLIKIMTTQTNNDPPSSSNDRKRQKRGADDSLVLSDNTATIATTNNSSYPTYLVAESADGSSIDLSIFAIQKLLIMSIGDVNSFKKLQSGAILIEVKSKEQADKALGLKAWVNPNNLSQPINLKVTPHRGLNSSKGVIRCRDLRDCKDEELMEAFSPAGVTYIKHIMTKKNGIAVPTNTFVLTFDKPAPPKSIKAAYLNIPVEPFIPNPLRCYQCQKYGHGKSQCKHNAVCARCGKEGHTDDTCSEQPHCTNCSGPHPAYSKECPEWTKQQAIVRIKVERNITFPEAKQLYNQQMGTSSSRPSASYASICKPTMRTLATQTDLTWPLVSTNPVTVHAFAATTTTCHQSTDTQTDIDEPELGAVGGASTVPNTKTLPKTLPINIPHYASTPNKVKPGPASSKQQPGGRPPKWSTNPIKLHNKYGSLDLMDLEVNHSPGKGSGGQKKS